MGGQSDASESSCEDAKPGSTTLEAKLTGPYKCNYEGCSASFKKPSRLKQHMCRHTGERPFKCDRPDCSRAYTHAFHLRRHIAVNHQESLFQRKYKCSYPGCNLLLSNESNLKRHYRRAHEMSYVCKECGKTFKKNHHLRSHMISHAKTSPFRCQECNIGFASERLLKKHLRCHKKHPCSAKDCKEVFQKWTQLVHHRKVAHPRATSHQVHFRTSELISAETQLENLESQNNHVQLCKNLHTYMRVVPLDPPCLEYVCDVCGKKCKSKRNITHHIETHMPDRPSFPCPYPDCERSYVRPSYLSSHIKWYHEGKGVMCSYEGCGRMICTKARWLKHMAWHEKDHTLRAAPRTGKSRKPRFDKGIPRRSMATTLAGIPALPLPLEKKIISGNVLDMEEDSAVKDLGEMDLSIVCEPGTSSAETKESANSTQKELLCCSY